MVVDLHWLPQDNPNNEDKVRLPTNVTLPGYRVFERFMAEGRNSLIPEGLRLFLRHMNNGMQFLLFEEPPQIRTVFYQQALFKVPTPWVVYVISHLNKKLIVQNICFARHGITSMDDRLLYAALPNVYTEETRPGLICAAPEMSVPAVFDNGRMDWNRSIAETVDAFWRAGCNNDIISFTAFQPFASFIRENQISLGFANWETIDVDHVLALPWSESWTVEELVAWCYRYGGTIAEDLQLWRNNSEAVVAPPPDQNTARFINQLNACIQSDAFMT